MLANVNLFSFQKQLSLKFDCSEGVSQGYVKLQLTFAQHFKLCFYYKQTTCRSWKWKETDFSQNETVKQKQQKTVKIMPKKRHQDLLKSVRNVLN